MAPGKHILVVEDCEAEQEALALYLGGLGYRVSLAGDGGSAREKMAGDPADLAIVDLVLPGEDGFSITRYLRERHRCGIILLTASTELTDRIVGLEVGADDYLCKPYQSRELLARIRSVMRRLDDVGQTASASPGTKAVHFDGWRLDLSARQLRADTDAIVELTSGEFNLLSEFVAKPGRVLSREHLLKAVHNRSWDYFDRSIDVLVTRLRRKLASQGCGHAVIKTVRSAGYIFTAKVS